MTLTNKDKAMQLASEAYIELQRAGIPEEYVPLLCTVAQANNGTFFGTFGSESGIFLRFDSTSDSFTPMKLSFGIRHHRQSIFSKLGQIAREAWSILLGRSSEYEIYLSPDDLTRLKDLLRAIS